MVDQMSLAHQGRMEIGQPLPEPPLITRREKIRDERFDLIVT